MHSRLLAAFMIAAGCAEPARDVAPSETPVVADTTSPEVISTRSVFFIEATEAEIDSIRQRLSEEDFYTTADDAMWYRSEAYDYLEKLKLPVTRLVGRRPLTFLVNGEARTFDFAEYDFRDLIVAYNPPFAPLVVPPVEVNEVRIHFDLPAPPDSAEQQ